MSFRLFRGPFTVGCAVVALSGALAVPAPAGADGPTTVAITWGNPGDIPLAGDWDGSGKWQIGAYRPSNQTFYLGDDNGGADQALTLGNPNDVPITGDWNGSGKTQIGAWRPSNATFYLGDDGGVSDTAIAFGQEGDIPITGDWDGSGRTQVGVYDPDNASIYLRSADGDYQVLTYGNPDDVPVTGDWDGAGRTQIGVFRPSNGTWYLGDVNGQSVTSVVFGQSGDIPITGDWTGSGITQLGVYDPNSRTFFLREVPPPAAPPVVTTPVATPIPTPPKGTASRPRVRAKVTISWTWNHGRTRIHKVDVTRLPRRARITLRCMGRGCPMTKRSATAAHLRVFVHRLIGTTYRSGDRLLITISAPGRVPERARITIRNGRMPLAALV
jgi:hypothetical protein